MAAVGGCTCSCKVGRSCRAYDLEGVNRALESRRIAQEESLRDLATYFNERILEAAIGRAGADLTDVAYGAVSPDEAVAELYETLTSESVPADRDVRVRTRLEQRGVSVETVESDWVSHPTMRSHLNDCLGIDTDRQTRIDREDARDTVEWARARCAKIVDQTVSRLVSAGLLRVADHDVSVSVRISCSECGQTYRLSQLLDERACSCYATA